MSHPSKDIVSTGGLELKGRKIAMCITGSISAFQCPKIARELMRYGADVYPILSKKSQKIIHPNLMEWATGNTPVTKLTGKIEHIAGILMNKVDLILISPATANTINKISCGISDTIVTTFISTALGSNIPIIIVPAMHESLFFNPILKKNIDKLLSLDIEFVNPRIEEGKAKMASVEEIVEVVIRRLLVQDMENIRILENRGLVVFHP